VTKAILPLLISITTIGTMLVVGSNPAWVQSIQDGVNGIQTWVAPYLQVEEPASSHSGESAGPIYLDGTLVPTPMPTYTPILTFTQTMGPELIATQASELNPTSTPQFNPTNTPIFFPTNTPIFIPTNTPIPYPTNTPIPNPTSTPIPNPTNTPLPNPTSTPVPNPTNTPDGDQGHHYGQTPTRPPFQTRTP
jgi:hypothetical protein